MKKIVSLFLLFVLSAYSHLIPCLQQIPVIDGSHRDPCWEGLPWHGDFLLIGTENPAPVQTRFKVFHDGSRLYLMVVAEEPMMQNLRVQKYSPGSTLLWLNDSIEISLVPDGEHVLSLYKLMIDPAGACCDLRGEDDNTNTESYLFNADWSAAAEFKVLRNEKDWSMELAIPFGAMNFSAESTNKWRLNVARNRYAGEAAQLSSWSQLPRPAHVVPKAFNKVELENLSLEKYMIDVEAISAELKKMPDGSFNYSINSTIHNNTPSLRILRQRLALSQLEDAKVFSGEELQMLTAISYKTIKNDIVNVQPGKYLFSYEIYSNNSVPILLKKISNQVSLRYQPISLRFNKPPYRNNIYATMPDKTIEVALELQEGVGSRLRVELLGDNFNEAQVIEKAGSSETVLFDGDKLPDGKYILRVSGKNQETDQLLSCELTLRKLPYQKGEVWLDNNGVTYVDGKNFLPFGWYGTHGAGVPWINSFLRTGYFSSVESAVSTLNQGLELGMRTILVPFQELDKRGWVPQVIFKDPDTRKKGLTPEQREKIVNFVSAAGKADGLLGWYMADEPECRDNNPLWYEEAYELIAELDPYHPCIMLNWGPDGIKKYYTGCDILLPDCYPQYFEDGSTGKVRWCSSDWAKTSTSLRPAWQMPLMTSWPALARDGKTRGVPADYHDQRSQFFQTVIHNVKGFNMYAWHDSQRFSSFIFGPDDIGKTIAALREYIFANTVPEGITVSTSPFHAYFQVGLKVVGKQLAIFAVNTSAEEINASFTIKQNLSQIYVAGEERAIKVQGKVFSDRFAPRETHIYLTDQKLANSVPNVQKTIDTINTHRAGRKKPGNLLGMGEMLEIDYINFGKGIIPPEVPIIKASSDSKFYMTTQTGSLYYLVDGLIEPRRVEYSWAPSSSDKSPWLEFTLPKAAPAKEVVIYTPNANLISLRVHAGKKSFLLENNTEKIISIKLDGEEIESLRIEILKHEKAKASLNDHLAARLITEVELY